jgi:hypothetical protein
MTMNMRNTVLIAIVWLLVVGAPALATPNNVAHVQAGVFTIGSFQLGKTTLNDVSGFLGLAPYKKRDDGLVSTLCYFSRREHQFVVMQFEASVLGGRNKGKKQGATGNDGARYCMGNVGLLR